VAEGTVFRIKRRFAEAGLEGVLKDRPQAHRYRKLDDRGEAHPVSSTGQALIAPRSWPGAGFGLRPSAGGAWPLDPAPVGGQGGGVGVGARPVPRDGAPAAQKKGTIYLTSRIGFQSRIPGIGRGPGLRPGQQSGHSR
jgi:hypothetical protein